MIAAGPPPPPTPGSSTSSGSSGSGSRSSCCSLSSALAIGASSSWVDECLPARCAEKPSFSRAGAGHQRQGEVLLLFIFLFVILSLVSRSMRRRAERRAEEQRREYERAVAAGEIDPEAVSPFGMLPFGGLLEELMRAQGMSRSYTVDPETGEWVEITDTQAPIREPEARAPLEGESSAERRPQAKRRRRAGEAAKSARPQSPFSMLGGLGGMPSDGSGEFEVQAPDELTTFADVGGMETLKQEVRDTVGLVLEHPDDAERYGIEWNGILLHGPPGVGKTYFAPRSRRPGTSGDCSSWLRRTRSSTSIRRRSGRVASIDTSESICPTPKRA